MNPDPPVVSFVVINYNYGRFLTACLESVLAQDFASFECIIIDNNSSDDSRDIARRLVERDSRLRLVSLDTNLNQLGAFLYILDELRGELVTIVDSDDLLFRNYASVHVAAHRLMPKSVAFTSSCVLEVDEDGSIVTSGYDSFLSRNKAVPLAELRNGIPLDPALPSDVADTALRGTVVVDRDTTGWHWSPGTANMHRVALMRQSRPVGRQGAYVGATDTYFMFLDHAIAGSAKIALPLSAYRIHTTNRFAGSFSAYGLNHATRAGRNRSAVRRRDITRELTRRPADFHTLSPGRFWRLMDAPVFAVSGQVSVYFTDPHVIKIIGENLPSLWSVFGEAAVRRELSARMGVENYNRLVHADRRPAGQLTGEVGG